MTNKALELLINLKGADALSPILRNVMGLSGGAQSKLHGLTKELNEQKKALRENQKLIANSSKIAESVDHLYRQEKKLTDQIEKTSAALNRQKKYMETRNNYDQDGRSMRDSATRHFQNGTMVAVPLIAVTKQATDFQANITTIRQKTGETLAQSNALQSKIIGIANDAMTYPQRVLAGMDDLMAGGMDEQSALKVIAPVAKAVTTYNGIMDDYTAAIFAQNTSLKTTVDDTTKSLNIMTYAGKSGKFDMDAQARFMPMLAAQAGAYGQRGTGAVADISAAGQAVERVAGNSDLAGNWLNNLYGKILTGETEKAFGKMGMGDYRKRINKMIDDGTSPIEAITMLAQQATKGDMSKLPLLMQDMQAQGAIRGLWQNMDYYRQIRADSQNPQNAQLDADMAMRSNDINTQFSYMGSQASGAFLNAMKGLMPAILPLTQKANELLGKFAAWSEKNPKLIQGIVGIAASFVGVNFALGGLKMATGNILPLIGRVVALNQKFGILKNGLAFLKGGRLVALLASPLGLAAGIGIAAFLIWKNWDKIVNWGKKLKAWADKSPLKPLIYMFAGIWMLIAENWDKINLSFRIGVLQFKVGVLKVKLWMLKLKQSFDSGLNGIKATVPGFTNVGRDAMRGLAQGIANGIPGIGAAMGIVTSLMKEKPKKDLQIHSPSRLTAEYGRYYTQGFGLGIQKDAPFALKAAKKLVAGLGAAGMIAAPAGASTLPAVPSISQLKSQTLAGKNNRGGGGMNFGNIQITINAAPGQNPEEIANAVAAEIKKLARNNNSRARGAYDDEV